MIFKIIVRLLLIYVGIAFIYSGYLFLEGEDKPWFCISKCNSTFERYSSAIPYFGFGFLLLWRTFKGYIGSFNKKVEKLVKKGKYCFKENRFKEPYCCKCYEEGILSKLKIVDGEYMCLKCDYTAFYLKAHSVDDIELKDIDNAVNGRYRR